MIKDYDANATKRDRTDQTAYKLNNLDLIIAVISASEIIVRQNKTTIAIYSIICASYLFIVIDRIVPQAVICLHIFEFNTRSCGTALLLFYLIAMKIDNLDLTI